jgi:hypothetical protein
MWSQRTAGRLTSMLGVLAATLFLVTAARAESESHSYSHKTSSWWHQDDSSEKFSYILHQHGEDGTSGSGMERDFDAAKRVFDEDEDTDQIYARIGDDRYVIRDRALLEKALRIMEPVQTLGRRQGELGGRQSQVGRQQSLIGAKQARVGRLQGEVGRRQGELAREIAFRQVRDVDTDDLERMQQDLETQMRRLEVMQEGLSRQQSAFAEKQEPLASDQRRYGQQMQDASKRMSEDMERFVREAIRSGIARPID